MNDLAPIILFVYNRPEHTLETLNNLRKNELATMSELFIFSDGAKCDSQIDNVNKVREIIKNPIGFKSVKVFTSYNNKGLANSVIDGVTQIIDIYRKAIVIEDDLKTSKFFLTFMNDALNYYMDNQKIWSISGYTPNINIPKDYKLDIYKAPRACSWGWGTWKNRWDGIDWEIKDYTMFKKNKDYIRKFNKMGNELGPMLKDQIDGQIDSWAVRWYYNQFKSESYTIYPRYSFIENKGFKGESTHGSISNRFETEVTEFYNIKFSKVPINEEIIKEFSSYFNLTIINYIGIILKKVGLYRLVKNFYKAILK